MDPNRRGGRRFGIGIDVGNFKSVVCQCKDGIVDAVHNEEGKRETPSRVAFADGRRLFGISCPMNNPNTITQPKRLFTKADLLPYKTSQKPNESAVVDVLHAKEQQQFTAREMLAMLLGHLKRSAEITIGARIGFCVMGVPSYFNARQRNEYLDAARIAGLNPLELLTDGEATATEYAIYRPRSSKDETVVFVDVGHCDTQVTVARFKGSKHSVLGTASDENLGGRDFDDVIFRHVLGKLPRLEESLNAKAQARLRAACEKAKLVLSANRETQVSVEALIDGQDMDSAITREEFEGLSSELLDRIVHTVQAALDVARLGNRDVDNVELVGSGTLVPAVTTALSDNLRLKVRRTLNGSECVARGCALRCEKTATSKRRTCLSQLFVPFLWFLQNFSMLFRFLFSWGKRGKKTEDWLRDAQDRERWLLQQDRDSQHARQMRNGLEAFIYALRSNLNRKSSISDSEKYLRSLMNEIAEWIDGDGEVVSADEYLAKISELRSMVHRCNTREYDRLLSDLESSASEKEPLLHH